MGSEKEKKSGEIKHYKQVNERMPSIWDYKKEGFT
jgi:hypothetical protein